MKGGPTTGIVAGMAAVAVGTGLILLAPPIIMASLAEIPATPVLKRLHGEVADAPALRRLIRSRERSLEWRETGRGHADLALARMVLGELGTRAEHTEQFTLAQTSLVRCLGLAPMNPFAWMRLVRVRMAHGHLASEIAEALNLALDTGPREDRMQMLVVEAGLHAWSALDDTDRDRVADRVRRAWRQDALYTAAIARRTGRTPLLARLVGLGAVDPDGPAVGQQP